MKSLGLLAVLLWLCAHGSGEKIPLHFFYMTSKTGFFTASGAIPVVDLALELINNRTDILPNYTLSYDTILDSQCSVAASLDAFFEHFRGDHNLTFVSLLCCGCTTSTIPVAEISHYWNIPHMAGIEGSVVLDDRQRFRRFFRTDATSEFVGPAIAEMARQFNWTQMATISRSGSFFSLITEGLRSSLNSEQRVLDTSIIISGAAPSFPYHLMHNLAIRDYRIIFINADQTTAYTVLCEAYYLGWFAPKYVWFIYGWYNNGWWKEGNGNSSCNASILSKVINDALIINPDNNLVSDNRTTVTFSGLTPDEYEMEYTRRLNQERYSTLNLTEFIVSGAEFDGMWAIALGLHHASERVRMNDSSGCGHLPGELVPLENFDYVNDRMGCVLLSSFHEVNFLGITGPVMFTSVGNRDSSLIRVQQYHTTEDGRVEKPTVADVQVNENSSRLIFKDNIGVTSLWRDGPPYDGARRERIHHNHLVLVSIYSVAAFAGLVYAVICLLFNISFRNKKVMKLPSRNLNYLVVAGAALLYASVFLYIFSERTPLHQVLCNIRQFSFSLGYTLCFGMILAKTWRIYYIFYNSRSKRKIPKDWFLFVIVAVVVAGDLVIILLGTAVPASRLYATRIPDERHPTSTDEEGISYDHYVYVCLNSNATVWLAVSYAYKGLLQLVAMLMSFHTRRVKIRLLNDSKEIAAIVYINSITLALLAVVEFALSQYHEVHATLFGLALLVGPTVFLTLTFIPKMVELYRDPQGKIAVDSSNTTLEKTTRAVTTMDRTNQPKDNATSLRQQLATLETRLAEVNKKAREYFATT